MPLQGVTVQEIREHFEEEKARTLTKTFDARLEAMSRELDDPDGSLREHLSEAEIRGLRAAQSAKVNVEEYDSLRAYYVAQDHEMRAAVEEREKAILEYLAPKSATSEALAQFMGMNEEQLVQAADIAAQAQMEDSLRLLLSVAQHQDYELCEHHVAGLMEEDGWSDLLVELSEAAALKELDDDEGSLEERFDTFGQEPGSKGFFYTQQSDTNFYGQLR